ncbi:MAG: gliding motility-associated ABC transporter substrate-binding protein GldG [Bacteroidia bacterium]|nr:gliding motility-associated ABC transporter substrate-binding protein GldG [Bacteroidia bacterium]MCF8426466.1 gliding motility-associated ABC transporter substrate-binding protein GldG [Bacteroidia bacterium]MCF8446880.1 gliding motility-associated ABC transporter substrate-binding protein GldG [Bacteroidia bacterium]
MKNQSAQAKKMRYTKSQSLLQLALVIAIVVVANLVLNPFFFRIDLTKEKRFSLGDASKKLAEKVTEPLYIKVFLEGEFPAGFKRLSKSSKEMLDEFAAYSHGNIQYEFIDPFLDANAKKTEDIIVELGNKGIQPTNVQIKKEDEFAQKIIIPGALAYYKGVEYPMNFLKSQFGQDPEEVINSSIELLEYEIANTLRKATQEKTKKIAIIEDHGELGRWEMAEAQAMLSQFYEVERLPLSIQVPQRLNDFAGIIIAKPTKEISEFDKFKIDQYIMNGGKVLWLIESQLAEIDSLQNENIFVSTTYPTHVDDMLFKYGIRINANIIQDLQCNGIPILSGLKDGVPQQKLLPWPFYPVAPGAENNSIVKGIEPVWFQFASSIDTLANPDIKKTVLFQSSPYSRVLAAPARVDLNTARLDLQPEMFRRNSNGNFIMGVLLEGKFISNFRYRFDASKTPDMPFKDFVENNKMIVISDGDVIRNQVKKSTGEVFPLGYDRYTRETFGNKKLIQNCIDYLCDDSGIIEIRSKEIKLRLLDKGKVKKERNFWTMINIGLPIALILLFGFINKWIRKRKYAA